MANKHDPLGDRPEIISIKKEAETLREQNPGMKQGHALEVLAKSHGFGTYAAYRAWVKDPEQMEQD